MIARTLSKTVVFSRPFLLKGIDRLLPAGDYRVVTDEEIIDGLSFPVYRRVATMIFVPAQSYRASSIEMVTIDPQDLQAARIETRLRHDCPECSQKMRIIMASPAQNRRETRTYECTYGHSERINVALH